ncbi:cytochrome P450 [Physcia stellaris]|nr:cytochrome P450 [Physcia stellaris]
MLPEFALPGRDRAHDTDYPVWVTPRDTETIYLARRERAVQAAKKAREAGNRDVSKSEGGGGLVREFGMLLVAEEMGVCRRVDNVMNDDIDILSEENPVRDLGSIHLPLRSLSHGLSWFDSASHASSPIHPI